MSKNIIKETKAIADLIVTEEFENHKKKLQNKKRREKQWIIEWIDWLNGTEAYQG